MGESWVVAFCLGNFRFVPGVRRADPIAQWIGLQAHYGSVFVLQVEELGVFSLLLLKGLNDLDFRVVECQNLFEVVPVHSPLLQDDSARRVL